MAGNGKGDESLRMLREGLDLAAGRTDELALRRVWGRLSEFPAPQPRRVRPLMLGGALLLLAGLGAAGFAFSLRIAEVAPPELVAARPTAPPAPPSTVTPDDSVPMLLGPATLVTGAAEARRVRLKGGALVQVASESTLTVDAGQRPTLSRGRIELEVPRQPPREQFAVEAGPYMIVVVGTRFGVAIGGRQVDVSVEEGVVEVWRDGKMVRLTAGHSWRGPLDAPTALDRRPNKAQRRRALTGVKLSPEQIYRQHAGNRFDQAKLALATGDPVGGLEILRDLATGVGPIAENSGYEVGLVLRDRLDQPRDAIDAWKRYRARFPRGLLRAEADLSIVETYLELGDREAARSEAEAFLRRNPRSERRAELSNLVQRLALDAAHVATEPPQ